MPEREVWLAMLAGVVFLSLAVAVMFAMHERHYQRRRRLVYSARAGGGGSLENIALRVETIEQILCEDRFT